MAVVKNIKTPTPESHDELAHDLALHIEKRDGKATWENITLRGCRPDVIALKPTYNLNQIHAYTYEVKVSRADFLQDVKKDKWRKYAAFSKYIFFACPEGLIQLDEVPEGCGLLWRTESGWQPQYRRKPNPDYEGKGWQVKTLAVETTKNFKGELSLKDWMKLAFGKWEAK